MRPGTSTGRALSFDEIAPTECRLQGSIFVTRRAHTFLKAKLNGSVFGADDYVDQMTKEFDKTTKHRFKDVNDPYYIKFGTAKDKDMPYGIRSGQLKLEGKDLAPMFEPSVASVLAAIQQQRRASLRNISFVFLVGGFAANNYLFKQLQTSLLSAGVNLSRPDGHINKAVADGAVSFYLDHLVSSRTARATYGVEVVVTYDSSKPDHRKRQDRSYVDFTGVTCLSGAFTAILLKVNGNSSIRNARV